MEAGRPAWGCCDLQAGGMVLAQEPVGSQCGLETNFEFLEPIVPSFQGRMECEGNTGSNVRVSRCLEHLLTDSPALLEVGMSELPFPMDFYGP